MYRIDAVPGERRFCHRKLFPSMAGNLEEIMKHSAPVKCSRARMTFNGLESHGKRSKARAAACVE